MKTKHIVALITFFVAFGFSTLLTRFVLPNYQPQTIFTRSFGGDRTQRKIYRLLQKDIRNGQQRLDRFSYSQDFDSTEAEFPLSTYAKAVNQYADKSASLDDSGLPLEFQTAWRAHMQAWRKHSDFLNQVSSGSTDLKLSADDYRRIYNEQDNEISATWYRVLDIADRYDARPYGAY